MLETLMENQVIFFTMGAAAGIGVLSKLISHITLRRLVRAASKMNKSNHKFMRLVKAKFEHASMISDKVQNVSAFLKKYVYEYRVFGIRLHTWRSLEKKSIWLVGILGTAGTTASYYLYGLSEQTFFYGACTGIGVVALFLIHISSDENYRVQVMENYMVDFLENVCAHRYYKTNQQKELRQAAVLQMEEAFDEEEFVEENNSEDVSTEKEPEEEKVGEENIYAMKEAAQEMEEQSQKEKCSQEVRIREILKEFLA